MPVTGSLVMADTGQAETQDGSAQCMQEVFMNAKPLASASLVSMVPLRYILMMLNVYAEVSSGVSHNWSSVENSGGLLLAALQAATQALQPIHKVESYSRPKPSAGRGW